VQGAARDIESSVSSAARDVESGVREVETQLGEHSADTSSLAALPPLAEPPAEPADTARAAAPPSEPPRQARLPGFDPL
jgi:hypothetical protein